jgi:hypothetical protein
VFVKNSTVKVAALNTFVPTFLPATSTQSLLMLPKWYVFKTTTRQGFPIIPSTSSVVKLASIEPTLTEYSMVNNPFIPTNPPTPAIKA